MKAIKLCPDVNYDKTFGTAGPNTTQALGAYSALSLCFGHLVVQSPAIVLKNDNYDLLIGTIFLRKWKCKSTLIPIYFILEVRKFLFSILRTNLLNLQRTFIG